MALDIANMGERPGSDVVQVYARAHSPRVPRPDRELVAFAKVTLAAGETRPVALELGDRAFAHWDVELHAWVADPGNYRCCSARRPGTFTASWRSRCRRVRTHSCSVFQSGSRRGGRDFAAGMTFENFLLRSTTKWPRANAAQATPVGRKLAGIELSGGGVVTMTRYM